MARRQFGAQHLVQVVFVRPVRVAGLPRQRLEGYARELALPDVKRDVVTLTRAMAAGETPFDLQPRRPHPHTPGQD